MGLFIFTFVFFHFYHYQILWKVFCRMRIKFKKLIGFFFYLLLLVFNIIKFFNIIELFISLKKSFSKSFFAFFNLVFMSIYGFNHTFWLNWSTLCTFLVLIHDLVLVCESLYVNNIVFLVIKVTNKLITHCDFHSFR